MDKIKKPKRSNLGRGLGSLLGGDMSDKTGGFEEKKLSPTNPQVSPSSKTQADGSKAQAPNNTVASANMTKVTSQNVTTPQHKPQVSTPEPIESREFIRVGIEKLIPNREQPRKTFSAEELKDLASSIKEKGLIQPILVRPIEKGQYQIIAGERRWRASQQAGLDKVPVLLKDVNPQEVLELALIENIQRHDLNPIEEAEAYYVLSEKYKLTQKEIADKVGKDRTSIANSMRILGLCREVRELVKNGDIQLGHAKVLLGLDEVGAQKRLANKIVKEGLSVRATEKAVKNELKSTSVDAEAIELESETNINDSLIQGLAANLQKELGTRVNIHFNGKSGRVEIAFYSIEELNNLADKLQS